MYQPSPADLERLGFRQALQTSGIWRHHKARADIWLVLLPPTGFALSLGQYDPGTRYEATNLTKAQFFSLLMQLNPYDFKLKK